MTKHKIEKGNSRLDVFNSFHMVKEKIADDKSNQALLVINLSNKKRADTVCLNLGSAYANDDLETLVLVNGSEALIADPIVLDTDAYGYEQPTATRLEYLKIQLIPAATKEQTLEEVVSIERVIRQSKRASQQVIVPLDIEGISEEYLKELVMITDQVVLVADRENTYWKATKQVMRLIESQDKRPLGFIWID